MAQGTEIKIGLQETGGNGAIVKDLHAITQATQEAAAKEKEAADASDAAFERKMRQFAAEIEEQKRLQEERRKGGGSGGSGGSPEEAAGPSPVKEAGLMASVGRMRTAVGMLEAAWHLVKGAAEDAVKANANSPAQALVKSFDDIEAKISGFKTFFAEGLGHLIDPENKAGKYAAEVKEGLEGLSAAADKAAINIERISEALAKSAEEARRARDELNLTASSEERILNQEKRLAIAAIPEGASAEEKAKAKQKIEMDSLTKQIEIRDDLANRTSKSYQDEAKEKRKLADQMTAEVAKLDADRVKSAQHLRKTQQFGTREAVGQAMKGYDEISKWETEKAAAADKFRKESGDLDQKAADVQFRRRLDRRVEVMDRKVLTAEGGNSITKAREEDAKKAETEAKHKETQDKSEEKRQMQEEVQRIQFEKREKISNLDPRLTAKDKTRERNKIEAETVERLRSVKGYEEHQVSGDSFRGIEDLAKTAMKPQENSPQAKALRSALDNLKDGGSAAEMGVLINAINELATTMKAQNYSREISAMKATVEQLKKSLAQDRS